MMEFLATLTITSPEFGSALVWLLFTFPAYWFYQWFVEHEPLRVY